MPQTVRNLVRLFGLRAAFVLLVVTPLSAQNPPVAPSPNGGVSSAADPFPQFWLALACVSLYLLSLVITRWHNIAKSVRAMITGQINALTVRVQIETGSENPEKLQKLVQAVAALKTEAAEMCKFRLRDFFFWSRGTENASWIQIHEIERQLSSFLSPPEYVEAYLHEFEGELRAINKPTATSLADIIHAELTAEAPKDSDARLAREQRRKALLGQATAAVYAERDTSFSTLMEWQNKAVWLIFAACILMLFLVLAAGHAVLLLAGGIGGYLSRLMRALKREDVPLDYGASWTTLWLSPLFGAFGGWFIVALIVLASNPDLNLLGSAFTHVKWDEPWGPVTISVAFLAGFSERFFDAVIGALEDHATNTPDVQKTASQPTPKPPAPNVTPNGSAVTPGGGGMKLVLPSAPLGTIQLVHCKVQLDDPADQDVGLTVAVDQSGFDLAPAALTIKKGDTEGGFDIVPKKDTVADSVTVTVKSGSGVQSGTIQF